MTYRITDDGTVLSMYDHKLLADVNFNYYYGIQYVLRNNTFSGGVHRYIPKIKPFTDAGTGTDYNLTTPYNVTVGTLPVGMYLTSQYWEYETDVPNRQVDYMRNAQNENVVAFAGGRPYQICKKVPIIYLRLPQKL